MYKNTPGRRCEQQYNQAVTYTSQNGETDGSNGNINNEDSMRILNQNNTQLMEVEGCSTSRIFPNLSYPLNKYSGWRNGLTSIRR